MKLCRTRSLAKLESEPESEQRGPFFATGLAPKWLAASPFVCLLYKPNRVRRPVDRLPSLVLHSLSLFAVILYSSKESTASRMLSRKSFQKARKAAVTLKGRTCTKFKTSTRFCIVLALKIQSALLPRLTNTVSLSAQRFSKRAHGRCQAINGCTRFSVLQSITKVPADPTP